ncbi:hypothetical protein P153DRAFT_357465 [Dothidotthia symphoricarpi CBS 119687]|uniref:Hypercellular protein-like protein HypA n=1 Tax=Dothidotthia symphoricarpi CBS 119687 TaxID=1392245 RepID=A0A6A6AB46_9PLEO|nr:uncharacterized protein P153DRAFT_357465 [Dothidotthia symphoricarpi CBS 119687]KAF2128989.1 hypothetical protein P153DRAFT_357465 [Dothidotthia symphoricarpi CBS 119687]
MFSPLAYPSGTLLYDLSTSLSPASHLSLSPFEQFREPLLIIGIGDATEYAWLEPSRTPGATSDSATGEPAPEDEHAIAVQSAVKDLREQFPRAYLHSFMMFDYAAQARHHSLPEETVLIPPKSQLKTTTMKTFMCDLTATLLAEMTTLARSYQALPTIASPASQSGNAGYVPSWANQESATSQFSRRNSQVPTTSRPESPETGDHRDIHRMSMPVLSSAPGDALTTEDPRVATSTTQGARTPPTTFDEIPGVNATNSLQRTSSNSSKSGSTSKDRGSERVSIHGFGSGGVGERARNKGRGRVSIVIGTLYMLAGQWHEALRELIEGATKARAYSDHLWHAKALENIMVCLTLCAWSGVEFQIPSICYPMSDKLANSKSPQHTPSNSNANLSAPARPAHLEAALESLNSLLPDLVNMILNIYTRAANFAGESMPPLAFSECVIRFSKLLSAINLSAGHLDDDALRHLVLNTPYRQKPRLSVPRLSVNPTRNDIAGMLFRALPGPVETSGISPTDRVMILSGIASVLTSLGLQRKKAIVMREFITSLIPGLVQARKVGAAEMGVHPAAGLAALNVASGNSSGAGSLKSREGEAENGIDEFLGLLGRIYGIPNSKQSLLESPIGGNRMTKNETSQDVVEDILTISSMRAFGSLQLKLDVLRMCLNFCEALPNFNGILHFTALILRIAGPGTAPKSNSTDVFVSLLREEQVRLFSNVSRTVTAAKKLGLQNVETEYWDDFLVRGLFILEEPEKLRLTHHRPAELQSTTSGNAGPFIHNPWLKRPEADTTETVLVANEKYRFVIALQNPYDFELGVDSLRIAAKGVEFVALEEHFILGPYRTQKFQIAGRALSSGKLEIIGCHVKVVGCRERLFPIFPQPWKPTREPKMKKIGLKACLGAPASRPSTAVPSTSRKADTAPTPESLTFNVIPDQPVIVVTKVSLPQSALMVLEGEKKRFTVTVKNTSQITAVDFVHISFQDSATASVQAATSEKGISAAELHELEVQLAHFPSLRWCRNEGEESISIAPGAEMDFAIEVVGRTRLTEASIQIDYANLGKRRSEVSDQFSTRQVFVPISITVNASVQLQRPDILPLSGDISWHNQERRAGAGLDGNEPVSGTQSSALSESFLQLIPKQGQVDEYCMLLLDFRNSWPNPLSVSLQVRPPPTDNNEQNESPDNTHAVHEVIQPGHVNRVVVVIPKIYLPNPHATIPSLNPANQRQFVVSTSKISPETERATREAFWYRDSLLQLVHGTWTEESNNRTGAIELRSMHLTPRMVEAVKLDDIKIDTHLVPDHPADDTSTPVRQLGRAKFEINIDTFLTLKTSIHNRSPNPLSLLLRLQPHLAGLPHNIALDLDKRFSWTGVLQRKLPVIQPGQTVESELGIVALCSGTFEIGATVDEVEVVSPVGGGEEGKRARSDTQSLLQGGVLGAPGLRSWYGDEPCTIVARRGGGR